MVIGTFTLVFLIGLYFVYKVLRIQYEQSRFRNHKYIKVQQYERNKKRETEEELEKLRNSDKFKEWQKSQSKARKSAMKEVRPKNELEKFEEQFGIVSEIVS